MCKEYVSELFIFHMYMCNCVCAYVFKCNCVFVCIYMYMCICTYILHKMTPIFIEETSEVWRSP